VATYVSKREEWSEMSSEKDAKDHDKEVRIEDDDEVRRGVRGGGGTVGDGARSNGERWNPASRPIPDGRDLRVRREDRGGEGQTQLAVA